MARHVVAIVELAGKSGVIKVEVLGQVEEIEFQSRSIDTVSCEQTLMVSFSLCQEGQEFPGRRYDLAFHFFQPFHELFFVLPAELVYFFIGRHDACSLIEKLLADVVIRPAASGDLGHGLVIALQFVKYLMDGVHTGHSCIDQCPIYIPIYYVHIDFPLTKKEPGAGANSQCRFTLHAQPLSQFL